MKGRTLDRNHHERPCLEETDCRIGRKRRLISIEPEVIQRAEANRVGVLIDRKSFRAPSDGTCVLGNIPRSATIASVSLGAVMREARVLRRCMESDVSNSDAGSQGHGEGLNCAIKILVIERVLIVPDATRRVGDFVSHKPNTIGARGRFDLVYRSTSTYPSFNGWLLSMGGAHGTKTERLVNSSYGELLVGSVVIHVALARMGLAPGIFMRNDVFRFSKIGRPRV